MNEIVWTKEELKKIKDLILDRANLKLNPNGIVTLKFQRNASELMNFALEDILKELNNLINIHNKNEIFNILELTKGINIKIDKHTPALLKKLTKINSNDATQIFVIFRCILLQFSSIIQKVAKSILFNIEDPYLILNKIREIEESQTITTEELYIKNSLYMIFNSSNGVCDSPLFKPLINKCYSNIKPKLLEELNNELAIKQKKYEIRYNRNYTNEFYQRKGRL